MADFLVYMLKASACIAVFYAFYFAFLKKERLFVANRFFLLLSLVISFLIPLIHFSGVANISNYKEITRLSDEHFLNPILDTLTISKSIEQSLDLSLILMVIYILGVVIMLLKICLDIRKIYRIVLFNPSRKLGRNFIVFTQQAFAPFSFFHFIFVSKNYQYKSSQLKLIVQHEQMHAKQLHSIDIIIAEFVKALLWFNPFVFFYFRSIKENHEYLADAAVISKGHDLVEYIQIIVNEVFKFNLIDLSSHFYCSTKKRIVMITNIKSSNRAKLKFLLVIPVILIVVFSFTNHSNTPILVSINKPTEKVSDIPSIWPVAKNSISKTSGFGMRMHPIQKINLMHEGIDLQAKLGEKVVATASGIIIDAKRDTTYGHGLYITIKHNEVFSTFYSHLQKLEVKEGEKVNKGQIIGYVGNTGVSTGPHLHYEVIKNGVKVNPEDYFKE